MSNIVLLMVPAIQGTPSNEHVKKCYTGAQIKWVACENELCSELNNNGSHCLLVHDGGCRLME